MLRNVFSGCVSDRSSQAEVFQCQKLKFGASLSSALKHGFLPGPLVDMLVFIAKDGVATSDVFRRPGNPNDTRRIVKRLMEGKQVIYSNYSFYTLASVIKKFLLKIPGGVLTVEGEETLLQILMLQQKMEQVELVHHFIESLTPAHQQLLALIFGTWSRIVSFSSVNSMSVEALSRSVAGSMFHTCAEDPAKVEKASRIMQFLIENYGVENMFGSENIKYFKDMSQSGLHIRDFYRYSRRPEQELIPPLRSDFIEVTRLEQKEGEEGKEGREGDEDDDDEGVEHHDFLGRERQFSSQSPELSPSIQHSDYSHDPSDPNDSQLMINMSTLSAPEVSLMPSPEVSKRPKSLEDNLNEVRSHYQSRCLSRFNSVKRKQLERLRQRSDWFLSPTTRESRQNSRKGREGLSFFAGSKNNSGGQGKSSANNGERNNNNHHHHKNHKYGSSNTTTTSTTTGHNLHHHHHQPSGNSPFTKASSEGAVLDAFSDGDSVFTDNTSRSESPASEPVWSHILKVHSRDIIHSDTIGHLTLPELSLDRGSSGFDISLGSEDDLSPAVDPIRHAYHHHHHHHHHHGDEGEDIDDDIEGLVVGVEEGGARSRRRRRVGDEDGDDENEDDDDDDDDENVTPTGTQEEEDNTLMTSSLPDIHQPTSASEDSGSSLKGEETDKDSPSTLGGGSGEDDALGIGGGGTTLTIAASSSQSSQQHQHQQQPSSPSSSPPPPSLPAAVLLPVDDTEQCTNTSSEFESADDVEMRPASNEIGSDGGGCGGSDGSDSASGGGGGGGEKGCGDDDDAKKKKKFESDAEASFSSNLECVQDHCPPDSYS